MPPAIITENLTRKFGDLTAVDGLNLEVHYGEVFGFLGPNGAGKTTTVRMLTALIAPTRGGGEICGYRIGRDDTWIRRSVGILTETPGLYENLSAEHNLKIYASLYEVEDPMRQVEKYLRLLGLWERRSDIAETFSKGMKQKLAIARAFLHEPKVVFLDEPTASLDPEASHLVRESIESLRGEGRAIFLCTHNLDEADRLCDRVGVFRSRLMVIDTPANLRLKVFQRRVVFHLARADEQLLQIVRALPYVEQAQLVDNKLIMALDEPEMNNPEIVRMLAGAGADIQFVGEIRRSLEDVYMQLMKNS